MPEFKWRDTHTYPDYNLILTKRFVRATCRACGVDIDDATSDILRRVIQEETGDFIAEVCRRVVGEGRRKIVESDIASLVSERVPDLAVIMEGLEAPHRIVKLSFNEKSWRCYLYFQKMNETGQRLEDIGFRRIYPHFYVIEKSL